MATARITTTNGTRRVEFDTDVRPDDPISAVALLRRRCETDRLGDPARHKLEIWDQRRGWVEFRT